MNLNQIPILAALTRKMDWLNDRQRVIAQNVANADTPGYKPSDLKSMSFKQLMGKPLSPSGELAATNARHLVGTKEPVKFATEQTKVPFETTPSGNGVALEEQMAKMAETQMDFVTATSLYKKHVGILRAALGRRGG